MANLVELFDNIVQMQNLNGVPLAAGKLYVYALGRTRLMDSWSDVDGESLNPNPIILDDAGQAHVYVSDDFDYTLVVCDQYNNEIFSLDKYLFSEGSHSHADVAVAPSEHIGVSSYHVGEVTVYVPYLTGEVGKVYEGIDPIVVNNDVNRISANHIPLGVQDPLYFVEDSETACIIGCSAQTEIPAELSGKWDNASDVVIANSAQWGEGTTYEAGSYIDIDGNTINVTGLQPEGDYAYNSALSSKLDVTALPQDLVHSGDLTAYYPSDNPSGFITGIDLSDYATNEDLQTVSADITAMIPTALTGDYLTKESADTLYQPIGNYLSSTDSANFLLTSTSGNFYPMEGNPSGFLTAHQSLQGYATEDWVTGQGYLTAHQSLDGLMSADLLEISDNKITGYNGTAFAGQGGGVTGDYELSAGSGISIVDYPLEQKTVISVTAQGGNQEVEQAVIDNSATWDSVTAKQNPLTFGYNDTAISSIDESAIYDSSAHARINTLAGRISDLSSNKLDTTAFSDVSSSFLTAVPDTYLQNTDLTITDNKVTEISGIPLSAGGEVPEGTMVESGLEYNSQGYINGYSGSAIATIDQERQWFTHDDTLVHLSNSAQYALGVNVPEVASASQQIIEPVYNTKTFAGYWNGSAVYQKLITGEFTTNVTSDVHGVDADYSASQRKWIDPSQSFIHYGSTANVLPTTWVLGATSRLGGLSLLGNIIRARSNDTTNTQCTAFVVVKWIEN